MIEQSINPNIITCKSLSRYYMSGHKVIEKHKIRWNTNTRLEKFWTLGDFFAEKTLIFYGTDSEQLW